MDNQSITHTRWNCTYHIVFIPKYRRKIMYGETKKDLVAIIKKLCEMKQVDLIDGRVCKDHIHMYVAIPPKISVSEFMSYLKGKSTLMLFDRHPEYRTKWGDRHFWARGYYVSTVGNVNEETILKYIQVSDGKLMETQTANYFSDIYPIDCAVLSANAQSCQKCCTLLSVLFCA